MSENITTEYLDLLEKSQKEFGGKTCLLMEIGSFYELLGTTSDDSGNNIREITQLLNIQLTKSNKNIKEISKSNPLMAGFPTLALDKFLPVLLQNGYTVVVANQYPGKSKNRFERRVSAVYSPSIQPISDNDNSNDEYVYTTDASLTYIFIECVLVSNSNKIKGFMYSIAHVNMTTNSFQVQEFYKETPSFIELIDDISKEMSKVRSSETIMRFLMPKNGNTTIVKEKDVINRLGIDLRVCYTNETDTDYKRINQLDFQNEKLKGVYSHINFGLLSPIEMLGMEKLECSRMCVMYVIDFIRKHEPLYLAKLSVPKVKIDSQQLILELDTLRQLHIVPQSVALKSGETLFDIVNKTKTAMGRRGLWNLLTSPYKSTSTIAERFECIAELEECIGGQHGLRTIQDILQTIPDLERLSRRMSLGVLKLKEVLLLLRGCEATQKLVQCLSDKYIKRLGFVTNDNITLLIDAIYKTFNVEKLQSQGALSFEDCFNLGCFETIDKISITKKKLHEELDSIKKRYDDILAEATGKPTSDWIKINCNEQDGYHFQMTKIRYNVLEKKIGKLFRVKGNNNTYKITTSEIESISNQIKNTEELLIMKVRQKYKQVINEYYDTYVRDSLPCMIDCVKDIDIFASTLKTKYKYKYCRPDIVEDDESWLECEGLRHPIIERLKDDLDYVPNDVILNRETKAIVLYALNSCGKSSLLRAIGLSVILAQSGLYVPCTRMRLSPFHTIVSQVDLQDNIYKSQSSFVAEMVGLKHILKIANPHCLVLADEVCKGSEQYSATSIFAASVKRLVGEGSKLLFTTHLHGVAKLDQIKSDPNISIMHLSVSIDGDNVIFDRKLKPGPCSDLYGLEVARAVGLDKEFIKSAFELRSQVLNNTKKSRYNTKKIIDKCEICMYKPLGNQEKPLHTHHIKFQKDADKDGFVGVYHKNRKSNLVALCDECHTKVHDGDITILGYVQTLSGVQLRYEKRIK